MTDAPSAAKRNAIAAPIPRDEPVTSASLFSNGLDIFISCADQNGCRVPRHKSSTPGQKRLFTFSRECRIDRHGRDVLEIVADGLESNAEQQFHHLLLPVASGDEVLYSFFLRIAALANQFLHEGHEGIELLIGYGVLLRMAATTSAGVCRAPFA